MLSAFLPTVTDLDHWRAFSWQLLLVAVGIWAASALVVKGVDLASTRRADSTARRRQLDAIVRTK